MMTQRQFVTAIEKSRAGDMDINTPYAAASLHELLCEQFKLETQVVTIDKVNYAEIQFGIKEVVYILSFIPGQPFNMQYRHKEAVKWQSCNYDQYKNEQSTDINIIMTIIEKHTFNEIPSPI